MHITQSAEAAISNDFGRECEKSIKEVADGDISALSALYENFKRPVFLLSYSILRDYSLAEDVTQETFLHISSGAGTYRRGTNPKAWIFKIARNLALSGFDFQKDLMALTELNPLKCSGKGLDSASFTAQKGLMDYNSVKKPYTFENNMNTFRNYTMRLASASLKKATVCTLKIPKSILPVDSQCISKDYHTVGDEEGFMNLWNSGKLYQYANSKFNKKIAQPWRYRVFITFDWNPIDPDEKISKDVYVVTIADSENKNYEEVSPIDCTAKSVSVKVSDVNANVFWDADDWHTDDFLASEIRKAYMNAKSGKGSPVVDTITVRAKFKDGAVVTKHIEILFNEKLKACMRLTD